MVNILKDKTKNRQSCCRIAAACFLILISGINLFAQYRGAPVKRERLIKVLRSKQLQTRDIVSVINSNGVDFKLTEATKQTLVAAGARPEVIRAVSNNLRLAAHKTNTFAKNDRRQSNRQNKTAAPNYDELLDLAMNSYQERQSPKSAARYLKAAVKLNPKNPAAYQMLGFVNMYGLKNLSQAEILMRRSIANGGSAVFRVYHDDTGSFTGRCSGSLYISPESIRFESDDNRHTFETSTINVDRIRLDTETNREWKNRSIFKVFFKIGKEKAKFRFAPISGIREESQMANRLITDSKTDGSLSVSKTVEYQ